MAETKGRRKIQAKVQTAVERNSLGKDKTSSGKHSAGRDNKKVKTHYR